MPAIKFNDNSFIPVTMLRQGLINTSTPPDLSQGILSLPANTGTTTFPKDPRRKEIHSFNFLIERELPWKFGGKWRCALEYCDCSRIENGCDC